jgi:hypothetical protein
VTWINLASKRRLTLTHLPLPLLVQADPSGSIGLKGIQWALRNKRETFGQDVTGKNTPANAPQHVDITHFQDIFFGKF